MVVPTALPLAQLMGMDWERDAESFPLLLAAIALAMVLAAESLHLLRVRRVRYLAFGPAGRASAWARATPLVRAVAAALAVWGMSTLLLLAPKTHSADGSPSRSEKDVHHVLMVLDVSPSMRLVDAGPSKIQSRMERARDLMESFFQRVPLDQFRISVVAVYNGAKPVVVDTQDLEVVRNILGDLPMHFAFPTGKTKLIKGIEAAVEVARHWNPRSTTLVLVSDGDTVPATGMPRMPDSIASTLVIGVGDPLTGKFIDGQQSRQDVSTLRQMATRMGGVFHNGNEQHLATTLLGDLAQAGGRGRFESLGRREYALIALAVGSLLLALLPLCLQLFGTPWKPGRRTTSRWSLGNESRGQNRGLAADRLDPQPTPYTMSTQTKATSPGSSPAPNSGSLLSR